MESLKSVEDALSWIAKLPQGTPKAIFRGQSQQKWHLLPSLFTSGTSRLMGFAVLAALRDCRPELGPILTFARLTRSYGWHASPEASSFQDRICPFGRRLSAILR